ncbi:hypothetical protein Emin_0622 [Elusimicrobium minutum Pei191]|uniref:Glycerophosphoryl diester phosphodiesterase membrane domain-containing protein n=2 Tax=Elusimicrobium TaxID=423604 RepID=B2KC50_ELUMP|nr:hypothetical protein Emin_0622 [Elusimicrobium minutum Pei191]
MDLLKRFYDAFDLISESVNIFIKNIWKLCLFQLILFGAALVVFVPCFIAALALVALRLPGFNPNMTEEVMVQMIASDPVLIVSLVILLVITAAGTIAAGVIKKAAVSRFIVSKICGVDITIKEAFKQSFSRAWPLFMLTLVIILFFVTFLTLGSLLIAVFASMGYNALAVFFGFIVFAAIVFLAVCFLVYLSPLTAVVVIKKKNMFDAVKYSYSLVKGFFSSTFGYMILAVLISFGFSMAAGFINMFIQGIGAVLIAIFNGITVLQLVIGIFMLICIVAVNLIAQTYSDVPTALLYVNREAVLGDKSGEIADLAAKYQDEEDVNVLPSDPVPFNKTPRPPEPPSQDI